MELRPEVASAILDAMTPEEREGGVVYVAAEPMAEGPELRSDGRSVTIGEGTALAFVDPTPLANWSHPARYLLVDGNTLAFESVPASFPPFGRGNTRKWRVLYRAPSVPDAAVPALE